MDTQDSQSNIATVAPYRTLGIDCVSGQLFTEEAQTLSFFQAMLTPAALPQHPSLGMAPPAYQGTPVGAHVATLTIPLPPPHSVPSGRSFPGSARG